MQKYRIISGLLGAKPYDAGIITVEGNKVIDYEGDNEVVLMHMPLGFSTLRAHLRYSEFKPIDKQGLGEDLDE